VIPSARTALLRETENEGADPGGRSWSEGVAQGARGTAGCGRGRVTLMSLPKARACAFDTDCGAFGRAEQTA